MKNIWVAATAVAALTTTKISLAIPKLLQGRYSGYGLQKNEI